MINSKKILFSVRKCILLRRGARPFDHESQDPACQPVFPDLQGSALTELLVLALAEDRTVNAFDMNEGTNKPNFIGINRHG